jgi:hypothetical protein
MNRRNEKEIEMTAHEKYLQAMDVHHWALVTWLMRGHRWSHQI